MAFTAKVWKDDPDHTTPLSASALVDLETRLSGYTDARCKPLVVTDPAYGAVGDGTADDTAAIQAAITDADTTAAITNGGGAVYIPPGTYKITSTLTVANNVRIFGDGWCSLLRITGAGGAPPGFYCFTLDGGYRSAFENFAIDGAYGNAVPSAGGAFDMRSATGFARFTGLQLGDNLHTGFDNRRTSGDGEHIYASIRFASLAVGNVVGVRNNTYGWRIGGGSVQLNGHYLSNISGTSATQYYTTANSITWPLAGADVALSATIAGQWNNSPGACWIGGVRCTFTGKTGSTLQGVTGGDVSDGTYASGARVVQAGPVWFEVNFADTVTVANFMLQNGDAGVVEASTAAQSSAVKLANGSINATASSAVRVGRSTNWTFENVEFNGNGLQDRAPAVDYAGSGTPAFIRFVGCLFQTTRSHAIYHRAGIETHVDACAFDGCGPTASGSIWNDKEFAHQVDTTAPAGSGWDASTTTLNVDIMPPIGMRNGGVVLVDSELVYYTGAAYTSGQATLTGCTRGAFGTTAATHASGAAVTHLSFGVFVKNGITGGWHVRTSTFANQVNSTRRMAFATVVAPGTGAAYAITQNYIRSSVTGTVPAATGYLDAATGANRFYRDNASFCAADTIDVASVAGNVVLHGDRSARRLTGTQAVTSISWSGQQPAVAAPAGTQVVLYNSSTAQLTDGSNLKLAGNGPNTADDSITLVSDGTNWIETGRAVN